MSSLKNPTVRYVIVIVSVISIWIYAGIVNEILNIFDIPMYVLAVILLASIVTAHTLLIRGGVDRSRIDRDASSPQSFITVVLGTFFGIAIAILLSLLTVALFDTDFRRELTSPITTCARDDSMIKTLPVNQSVSLPNGVKLTVHTVAYNVPQRSDRPEETNAWYCAKATLVEVSVDNIPNDRDEDALSTYDLKLKAVSPYLSGKSSIIGNESDDKLYQTHLMPRGALPMLKLNYLPDGVNSSRGWLVFSVKEDTNNHSSELVYTKSGKIITSIPLPSFE